MLLKGKCSSGKSIFNIEIWAKLCFVDRRCLQGIVGRQYEQAQSDAASQAGATMMLRVESFSSDFGVNIKQKGLCSPHLVPAGWEWLSTM